MEERVSSIHQNLIRQEGGNVVTGWKRLVAVMAAATTSSLISIVVHLPVDERWHYSQQLVNKHFPTNAQSTYTTQFSSYPRTFGRHFQPQVMSNIRNFALYDIFSRSLGVYESITLSSTIPSVVIAGLSGVISYIVFDRWSPPKVTGVFLFRGLSLGLYDSWSRNAFGSAEIKKTGLMEQFGMRWLFALAASTTADIANYPLTSIQLAEMKSSIVGKTWGVVARRMMEDRGIKSFYEGYSSLSTATRIHRMSLVLTLHSMWMNKLCEAE